MATYSKVSVLTPSGERHQTITAVVAGDEIDVKSILGRTAQGIKIVPHDSSDEISIRLNNKVTIPTYYQGLKGTPEGGFQRPTSVSFVSKGSQHPLYTLVDQSEYVLQENLKISFIQVEDITFGAGGTEISIYVW